MTSRARTGAGTHAPQRVSTRRAVPLLHRDEAGAARAAHAQQVATVAARSTQGLDGLLAARDRSAIDLHDDVAGLEARAFGLAARDDVRDDRALGATLHAELIGDL